MESSDKHDYTLTVNRLEGIDDFPHWRRNARAYLTRYDHVLLVLEESPLEQTAETQ